VTVHRVVPRELAARAVAVHATLARLHAAGELDLACVPLWGCEGAVAVHDPRFPTVVSCMTSSATLLETNPSRADADGTAEAIALERAYIRAARHLHGLTRAVLDTTCSVYDARPLTASVVARGVADRAGAPGARPRPTVPGRVQLLFVGRLERRKGVDTLLEAVTTLIEQGYDVALTLAGPDTPDTEGPHTYREAFAASAAPAVAERVRFVGSVAQTELDELFAGADVVCQPSRYESHGVVLVEAMMFGRPIVTTSGGGIPEVVERDGNALIAEPGDVPTLVTAIRALVTSEPLRRRLAARSRARYVERFAIEVIAPAMVDLFAEAIAVHAARRDAPPPDARLMMALDARAADAEHLHAAWRIRGPRAEAELHRLSGSRSWRVTRPLRTMARVLRGRGATGPG
jgi:glycogen(starch) synthase